MAEIADKCANANNEDFPPAKKVKLDKENANEKKTIDNNANELNLSDFKVARILQNNCARKLICVEGTFENRKGPAIVLLEQKSFSYDTNVLKKSFFDENTIFRKIFTNDIYRTYICSPTKDYNSTSICYC